MASSTISAPCQSIPYTPKALSSSLASKRLQGVGASTGNVKLHWLGENSSHTRIYMEGKGEHRESIRSLP